MAASDKLHTLTEAQQRAQPQEMLNAFLIGLGAGGWGCVEGREEQGQALQVSSRSCRVRLSHAGNPSTFTLVKGRGLASPVPSGPEHQVERAEHRGVPGCLRLPPSGGLQVRIDTRGDLMLTSSYGEESYSSSSSSSVWSALPPLDPSPAVSKPLVVAMAAMDAASFFRDSCPGAESPISVRSGAWGFLGLGFKVWVYEWLV